MLEDVDMIVGMLGSPSISSATLASILRDFLTILKGFRNGLVYGAKIRLPHALVMTLLFRPESLWEKGKIVANLTKTHAWNLARFVAIYKSILIILRRSVGVERGWHSFLAGCVGGYLIFSTDSNINNQIVMYLLARVLTGLSKLIYDNREGWLGDNAFKIEATVVWGAVMYLFRQHRDTLQSSLQASMQYLYNDSERWKGLWTLFIHNK